MLQGEGAGVVEELVEQSLGEEARVVGGREDAGVPGDSAHAARGRVVDGTAQEVVEVGVGGDRALVVVSGGCGLRVQPERRPGAG